MPIHISPICLDTLIEKIGYLTQQYELKLETDWESILVKLNLLDGSEIDPVKFQIGIPYTRVKIIEHLLQFYLYQFKNYISTKIDEKLRPDIISLNLYIYNNAEFNHNLKLPMNSDINYIRSIKEAKKYLVKYGFLNYDEYVVCDYEEILKILIKDLAFISIHTNTETDILLNRGYFFTDKDFITEIEYYTDKLDDVITEITYRNSNTIYKLAEVNISPFFLQCNI